MTNFELAKKYFLDGCALLEEKNFIQAEFKFQKSLELMPDRTSTLTNLSATQLKLKKYSEAKATVEKALLIDGNNSEAHLNLGLIEKELKSSESALKSFNKALDLNPHYAEAWFNKGNTLCELQSYVEAITCYDKALSLRPDYVDASSNKNSILHHVKGNKSSIASYEQALEAFQAGNYDLVDSILKIVLQSDTEFLPALHILGLAKAVQNKYKEAAELLGKAAKLNPSEPSILYNLAKALSDDGSFEDSFAVYERVIKLAPNYLEAWMGFGEVLVKLKHYEQALDAFNKVTLLNPQFAEAWSNKGNVLHELKHYDEALESLNMAITIDKNFAQAYYNRGITESTINRLEEAIASFTKAISLQNNFPSAKWNQSLCFLRLGKYSEGFIGYEARHDRAEVGNFIEKRNFRKKLWLGDISLEGKTILLYGEQGLGDFIQFCRYVKLVSDLGAKVILEVPHSLASLIKGLDGVSQFVIKGEELPFFDYQCPLLSLPLAFKTTLQNIPFSTTYLVADPIKVKHWHQKLGEKKNTRVGVAWSSVSGFKNDADRSLFLYEFVKALPDDGYEYICLQKEIKKCDEDFFNSFGKIKFYGDSLHDFSDTAALIDCVDLVISTCTSVPHLSAALGKETWILLAYSADWRWLLDRADSPWYPSVKLFRQPAIGDWNSVLDKVKCDLTDI